VHGFDIAKAAAADWVIPPADAAFTFELFLLRLLGGQSGNLLKSWAGKPNQRRIAVEFRSEHTEPAVIATHGGRVSVKQPGRDVDARIRFDPPALMLTIFRRHHPLRPVMTGKIVVSGRSPWLVPPFLNRTRAP
jgi:SCP-2 sterol transfer family